MNPFQNLPPVPTATLAAFDAACPRVEAVVAAQCLANDGPASTMGPDAPVDAMVSAVQFGGSGG